ncbi:DUF4126 domain-containing protein [Nocardiopsis dassonvillei]|uniref:DUF4126 domain-containing protein n=1 Tax=Nocardiopsis dassonvillei TaxID=2014 RepID=UPI0033C41285
MLTTLTGLGLASAAGLNAYIPLLLVGLLARFTDLVPLGESWQWIEHPVTLVVLTVLLVVEFAADKIPAVDSFNDVLQTVVRPTSGGITFGAGASAVELGEITGAASGAAAGGDGVSWWAVVAGVVVSLAFHAVKSLARPVANSVSLGCAAPVASFLEDAVSFVTSLLALLVPVLVLVVFPLMVAAGVWAARRGRRLRRERREARGTGPQGADAGARTDAEGVDPAGESHPG